MPGSEDRFGDVDIIRERARSFLEEALLDQERLLFDLKSRSLKPLCRIESTEEAVTVTFDLPYVDRKDITLVSTGDAVGVEAKTRSAVTLRVGGSVQRQVQFGQYSLRVRLPRKVEPEKGKATFKNGLLRVKFPIAKRGGRVRIK
ncbi:MAG: Hsp20/alpha crystallin family protein [Thaumarchaeota archaeon]|nr:Hsp20/alpha crystallin family protein [Nitrososphaerota archaeon]